jgi:hypothetical protein
MEEADHEAARSSEEGWEEVNCRCILAGCVTSNEPTCIDSFEECTLLLNGRIARRKSLGSQGLYEHQCYLIRACRIALTCIRISQSTQEQTTREALQKGISVAPT